MAAWQRIRRLWPLWATSYLVALAAVHTIIGDVQLVVTGVGVGTLMLGLAAGVGAYVKVREYMTKTDELEAKVNGGLAQAAKTHLQDNELFEALATKVETQGATIDQLVEERDSCTAALTELREWVVDRLDATGNGRAHPRGET